MKRIINTFFILYMATGASLTITAKSTSEVATVNNKTKYKIEVEATYSFDQEQCLGATGDEIALYKTIIQPNEIQQIPYSMGSSFECETLLKQVKITANFDENNDELPDKAETLYLEPFYTYNVKETSYGTEQIEVSTSNY